MGLQREHDDRPKFSDVNYEEEGENIQHKKEVRRLLEEQLERKRLKEELYDDLEGDFEWDDYER